MDWISLQDELPQYEEEVLLYFPNGSGNGFALGFRGKLVDKEGRHVYEDCWGSPEQDSFCSYSEEPTHWMWLPLAPY